jgi:ribonuclease HII
VAGVDEAGRGALAGPVVAAAVVLPPGARLRGLADSKLLTPAVRERLYERIRARALAVGVGTVESGIVDAANVLQATLMAMAQAVAALQAHTDIVLVDGNIAPPLALASRAIPHGDALVPAIAAASIVAKVTRDRLMVDLAGRFPAYGFDRHKGYGTADHQAALERHGPCPVHRVSFAPVRAVVDARDRRLQLGLPGIAAMDAAASMAESRIPNPESRVAGEEGAVGAPPDERMGA